MSDREQTYPQDGGGVPPLVFIAPALIVGAVIFLLARRNGSSANRAVDSARDAARDTVQQASRKGGNTTRRLALTALINALENDAARRVVITGLKFVRDRSLYRPRGHSNGETERSMRNVARGRSLLTATVIRGRRVTLRHTSEGFSEEEIARRYRWSLDQDLQYWSGSIPAAATLSQFRNDIIASVRQLDTRRDQFAVLNEDGELIGMISYYNWNPERGAVELGVYIGERSLWDRGYGTEAIRTLLDHLFQTTGLRAMYLNTYATNARARASYRKIGFETVGTMRKYSSRIGYYIDVQMRLTREDFIARYGLGRFVLADGPRLVPRQGDEPSF